MLNETNNVVNIHSVERISDKKIFTIGCTITDLKGTDFILEKIEYDKLNDNELMFYGIQRKIMYINYLK